MLPSLVRQAPPRQVSSVTIYGTSLFDAHQMSTYYVLGTAQDVGDPEIGQSLCVYEARGARSRLRGHREAGFDPPCSEGTHLASVACVLSPVTHRVGQRDQDVPSVLKSVLPHGRKQGDVTELPWCASGEEKHGVHP